jgi:hypothetical protein
MLFILSNVPKKGCLGQRLFKKAVFGKNKVTLIFEEDRRINLDMKKIIALSTLLALGALGMACGEAANTNTAANKAVNAANVAANAANTAANVMANAANQAATAANTAANAAGTAANTAANAVKAPANTTAANTANANAKKP